MPLWPKLATALLYLAAGGAALFLAHRAVRRTSLAAAAVLLLLPLAFTGRALLTGRSYAPFDLAYHSAPLDAAAEEYGIHSGRGIFLDLHCAIIPWRKAVQWALSQGEWPLWNPFLLCGDPLAGSAQPAPYYPVNLLALLLPLPLGFTFSTSLQLLLAAASAFLWCRELGCRERAALVGAAAWALSSFVGFWLEWPLGATLSLAPLVLLAVRRLAALPGAAAAGLLATALLLVALAGHPESLVHLVALGTTAALLELAARRGRRATAVVGWALAAGAVTLGLAAVFLLPVVEVLAQTLEWRLRLGTREQMHAARAVGQALRHLGTSLLPPQDASPRDFFLPPLASAYAGALVWAPALYGLARWRSPARWALAALALTGLAAGARLPGVQDLLSRLPLMGLAINDRLIFLAPLALAGLAALGTEAWLARQDGRAEEETRPGGLRAGGRSRGLGLLALALAAAVGTIYWLLRPAAGEAGVAAGDFAAMALWAAVPLAVAGAALVAGLPPRWGAALLLAALVVQRTGEMGSFYPALPPEAFYPRVSPLDGLPAESAEPYRVVGHQFAMVPNDATLWEIEDPRGYQAIHHLRYAEVVPLWSVPIPVWFNRVQDLSSPFLSFLNVRYALARRRFQLEGWELVRRGPGSWLWHNPRALGRAFVPRRVRMGVDSGQRLREMAAETDFARRAWIEPPAGGAGPAPSRPVERFNARGWAVVARRGTGYRLTTRLRQPGWVVISETAWNGWRAVEDRRELPLGIANHAFLALELPAGLHEVDLFYRPRAFEAGLAVSGATLALLVVAGAFRWLRRGRRGSGPAAADRTGAPGEIALLERPREEQAGHGLAAEGEPQQARRTGDRIAIPGEYQHRAYHQGPAPQRFWTRARIEEAAALLRIGPGDRVLDAGCGSGLLAARAAEEGAARVVGVDANPAAIEFARETFPHPALDFRPGLVDELDLATGSFDRIAFLEVIEHLSRAQGEAILGLFHRLLVPGGRLVLSTPNRASPWPLLESLLDRLRLVPQLGGEQHEVLYTLEELRALGEAAGFRLADWRMVNTFAPWAAWLGPRLAQAVHRWEVRHVRRHGSVMVLAFEKKA